MKLKLVSLGLGILLAAVNANAYDLKKHMHQLDQDLVTLQTGFIMGKKGMVKEAAKSLTEHSKDLFRSKEYIQARLPKGKEHLATVAMNTSHQIQENLQIMLDVLDDNTKRLIAQRSLFGVTQACIQCHNVVRDW